MNPNIAGDIYKKESEEKNSDEGNRRKESVEASLISKGPHNKALACEQDIIEVESSLNSSFSFNPREAYA